MALAQGSRFGTYEIVALVGEGGMGVVYRARDTRLDRDVALKILPDAFAHDADRLRRFEREAKALASLNHPNIAQIYGIEAALGHQALVMELVSGHTLAEIIQTRGALPVDDVVSIGAQIADALEAAHEAGIVHRDLKPANIKRRPDDVVKVLDFGLAKARDATASSAMAGGTDDLAGASTVTSPAVTMQGVILGTAGYMSPEQARGRVADKRADIWAFGVVLWEMLTGRRLFDGDTVSEVIAAVIKDTPRLELLPAGTPPALRQLIARCLERDPRTRLRDIGEARVMLARVNEPAGPGPLAQGGGDPVAHAAPPATPRSRLRSLALVAGALAFAGIAAFAAWTSKPEAIVPVRRFDLPAAMALTTEFAVAPDGSRIAYLADGHLYVRLLTESQTLDLGVVPPGTESVFFSPDGDRIGYVAESTLRIAPVRGGTAFTVCTVPASGRLTDATWRRDGTIFFTVWRESAYRVAATGGTPQLVAAIDPATEIDFHSVAPLPDDRLIMTTHLRGRDEARMDLSAGGKRTKLADDPNIDRVRFHAPHHILFVRIRSNPGIWTVPFDGGPVDLTKAVAIEPGARTFDASLEGTLVSSIAPKERRELVWVSSQRESGPTTTRTTRSIETVPGAHYESLTSSVGLSPEGRRAVVAIRTADGKEEFLIRDLATGRDTRVPLPQPPTGVTTGALVSWTPRGRLLYASGGVETLRIFDWPADGSGNGRPLVDGMFARMSPDGRELFFNRDERARARLYRAPVLADGSVGQAVLAFPDSNEVSIRWFEFSPVSNLLAFTSSEPTTGQSNVFLTTYPDLKLRLQVTSNGGTQPRFSHDGRQLYYLVGTRTPSAELTRGALHVVSLTTAPLAVGPPRTLLVDYGTEVGTPTLSGFAVAADGRLLMTRVVPAAPGDEVRLVLLQNWLRAIGK